MQGTFLVKHFCLTIWVRCQKNYKQFFILGKKCRNFILGENWEIFIDKKLKITRLLSVCYVKIEAEGAVDSEKEDISSGKSG